MYKNETMHHIVYYLVVQYILLYCNEQILLKVHFSEDFVFTCIQVVVVEVIRLGTGDLSSGIKIWLAIF